MITQVPGFELPESALLSAETRIVLKTYRDYLTALTEEATKADALTATANIDTATVDSSAVDKAETRQDQQENFYRGQYYKSLRKRYGVEIETGQKGGVCTETFIPAEGITPNNQHRVLINLHGGNFDSGSRTSSHMESIPVSALGKIKVISVDYRMAPEHHFPAATDDVVAVYKALLQDYDADNIGIYGASSGAHLTAQTLVRLQEEGITLPGAVGMISEGATRMTGDSVSIGGALLKATFDMDLVQALETIEYLKEADLNSPQVTPAESDTCLSQFPPSLLMSSPRDFMLSSVVATHSALIRLGVEADLHIWEGLDHIFHYNPDLPETRELHQVTVRFFDKHLGGLS